MLTLYVWPPTFGLPSSDPACLAAIAYLAASRSPSSWRLVHSTTSPQPLPLLHDSRSSHVSSGFEAIASHLHALDSSPAGLSLADLTAYSTFTITNLGPLLDLSLFVSSANYTATTRPALSAVLPFPLNYSLPGTRRSAARARCTHLDVAGLDLDDDVPPSSKRDNPIPESLRKERMMGVGETLRSRPDVGRRVRLDALVVAACAPLDELLAENGGERMLGGGDVSSLDCLVVGYGALALVEGLPSTWLRDCVRGKYPELVRFVEEGARSWFEELPWAEDESVASWVAVTGAMGRSLLGSWSGAEYVRASEGVKT